MAVKKVKGRVDKGRAVSSRSAPVKTKASSKAKRVSKPIVKTKKLTGDVYYLSSKVIQDARPRDWNNLAKCAGRDLKGFWEAEANELEWFSKWKKVLDDSKKPFFKWFTG